MKLLQRVFFPEVVKPGTMEMHGNGARNGDGNSLVTLTHSAVVAHSASPLKVAVPFEFCYRSV